MNESLVSDCYTGACFTACWLDHDLGIGHMTSWSCIERMVYDVFHRTHAHALCAIDLQNVSLKRVHGFIVLSTAI
jgi:hypothetical protein